VIPLHDENVTVRTPVVTVATIAACVVTWALVQGAGATLPLAESVCNLGLMPGQLLGTVVAGTDLPMGDGLLCGVDPEPQVSRVLTHMFLHGSWMHLIGNMWFLWLFGNNVEDAMTRARFVAFYLLCGLAAAVLQIYAEPTSIVPMVGASGAISGVMGAYLVLFPRVRVYTLIPLGFFAQTVAVPAWGMLVYWMVLQLLGGFSRIGADDQGGVAFWAHVGGFLAGVAFIKLFARSAQLQAHRAHRWHPPSR
jgi:membrane associated rhomboid family serine protease